MFALIYCDEDRPRGWVGATDAHLQIALRQLFHLLDAEGRYNNIPREFYHNLKAARQGDPRQIRAILNMRNGREHESWKIVDVVDVSDPEAPIWEVTG